MSLLDYGFNTLKVNVLKSKGEVVKKVKLVEKIPVRILKNSSYGQYQIKICNDYKKGKTKLKNGDEYICDSKLLKKINEKTWKVRINNYINYYNN